MPKTVEPISDEELDHCIQYLAASTLRTHSTTERHAMMALQELKSIRPFAEAATGLLFADSPELIDLSLKRMIKLILETDKNV